ncbi:MAG: Tol-Pal system beta propeller repeat protein TolB [Nitrospinae bacterium]|nr:Tol-Pal system beta propeller repeat protein TolB [Nitrospinota bacterium]
MKKIALTVLFLFLYTVTALAESDVYLNVARKGMEKVKIAIPDFLPEKKTFNINANELNRSATVLRSDLHVTDYFSIIWDTTLINKAFLQSQNSSKMDFEEWKLFGVDYIATGTYTYKSNNQLTFSFKLYNIKSKELILEKKYQGKLNALRLIIHNFADDVLLLLTGEKGIATTRILFESKTNGRKNVYVADYDGVNTLRISDKNNIAISASWTSDNERVFYTTYQNDNPNIIEYNVIKGKKRVFSNKRGLNNSIAIAPNGILGAYCYSKGENADIFIRNMNTAKEYNLTNNPAIETSPTWSPDGKRIAFESDRHGGPQIFMMDVEGGNAERLTFEGNYNAEPSWSPDGDKIAFTAMIKGVMRIAVVTIADKKIHYLTPESRFDSMSPTWSPNGRFILYSSNRTGEYQLYRLNMESGTTSRITFIKGGAQNPAWSFFTR